MYIEVEFLTDFATYKKKDRAVLKSNLIARLVNRGIVKRYKPKAKKANK